MCSTMPLALFFFDVGIQNFDIVTNSAQTTPTQHSYFQTRNQKPERKVSYLDHFTYLASHKSDQWDPGSTELASINVKS